MMLLGLLVHHPTLLCRPLLTCHDHGILIPRSPNPSLGLGAPLKSVDTFGRVNDISKAGFNDHSGGGGLREGSLTSSSRTPGWLSHPQGAGLHAGGGLAAPQPLPPRCRLPARCNSLNVPQLGQIAPGGQAGRTWFRATRPRRHTIMVGFVLSGTFRKCKA